MSAKRSTQTQQARRAVQSRPSASTLQKENQILRKQVLMLRAELDESGEVERFLRTRLRDLNANIRVDRARIAELEGIDPGESADEAPADPGAGGEN